MEFNELTDEQKAKVRACSSPDELEQLAKDEGIELTDDQLEAISGGWAGLTPCVKDENALDYS